MTLGPFTQLDQLYGACRVATDGTSDGTTDPDSYREGRVTATVRNGAGDYSVTLAPGIDEAEALLSATLIGASTGDEIFVEQSSDTNINVLTFDGGAATNKGFMLSIRKVRSAT